MTERKIAARERYAATLESDPSVTAEVHAVDGAMVRRLTAQVSQRTATRKPGVRLGALAVCGLLGVWVGWTVPPASPAPTLFATLQITPFADLPP